MRRVSVVIPCLDAGAYLDGAVRSALAQTWADVEVVIVDDGSRDPATLHLLDAADWPRTRVLRQANAGPSAARNRAIREASGEYILPLDADDTIEPTYVEKAVAVLDARPHVGCVYCKAMKFGAESGPWDLPPYTLDRLVVDNVIFVTALFRKLDWQAIGGFNEHLRHGMEDYDFWVRMIASGKDVVQLDEFLFNYRVQEHSRTTRFQGGVDGKVATYAAIFRDNQMFFATHAEAIFRHRFDLYAEVKALRDRCRRIEEEHRRFADESQSRWRALEAKSAADVAYWKERYGALDGFVSRHPWMRRLAAHLGILVNDETAAREAGAQRPGTGSSRDGS